MNALCKIFVRTTFGACCVLAGASGAFAQDVASASDWEPLQQLMQKNSCTACHFVDKRKYGPNFLEVAKKYENADPAAQAQLVKKMREGGAGVWGEDPMPPQPQLSQADAQRLLELMLALKPKAN